MHQSFRLPHALYGVRPLFLKGLKVLQDAALQDNEVTGASVETGARTWPEQDEEAFHRLLSRAELELSDPDAVRRREAIACLKLAAASAYTNGPGG